MSLVAIFTSIIELLSLLAPPPPPPPPDDCSASLLPCHVSLRAPSTGSEVDGGVKLVEGCLATAAA